MIETRLISIDPGSVSGAMAIFTEGFQPRVADLAVVDGQIDAAWLSQTLLVLAPDEVVVERVHAMPKQGVSSTFKFGVSYGMIQGVVAGARIPLRLVTPSRWQRYHGLIGKTKEASRLLAIQLYPSMEGLHLKKHHGRADALLLGRYFLETDGERHHGTDN